MDIGTLRERLAAFDDDTEVRLAPLMIAARVGEGRYMKVPHPLRHFDVENLFVLGDIDGKTATAGKRRVVIAFDDGSING